MKSFLMRQIIALVLLTYAIHSASGVAMKLTNLECQSFDETVVVFKECRLKVIGRGQVSLNVYVNVVKPLRNIMVTE